MELLAVAALVTVLIVAALAATAVAAVVVVRRLVLAATTTAGMLTLRATSYGVGQRSETARLRLALRTELDAVRRALAVASTQRWPVGDAPALVARLRHAAEGVDARLRIVAGEPRRHAARPLLPALRAEVDAVVRAASELRVALLAGGAALDGDELAALRADCSVEARALRYRQA